MYVYDETYYSDDYLKTLNDAEKTIMFKASFVAQMGMLYEEVVEYIKKRQTNDKGKINYW